VFNIAAGIKVTISGVTIAEGNSGSRGNGGDIFNSGTLKLSDDTITTGIAEIGGGLYNNGGTVSITGSTFSNSQAAQQGGAILNTAGGTINIIATTFSENTASQEAGGAICNENASLSLTGCTLTGNTSGTFGGAICNYAGGNLAISGTSMSNNVADFWGGAIFNYIDATVALSSGCSITANIAEGTFGGGLFNYGGNATISGTSFTGNLIIDFNGGVGGAIASELGTINISSSTFTDNGDFLVVAGGGIYVNDTLSTINSSTFTTNDAEQGGGMYEDSDDTLVMSGTTFDDNNAGQYGGGALINGAAYISNSTFAANEAQDGGGIINFQTLTLANCTISTNIGTDTSGAGGGLYANSGNTTIYNTIIAQNILYGTTTPSDITGILDTDLAPGQTPSSNNLIGTGGSGGLINGTQGNQVGVNANLGPLQNNGGSTDTMALLAGSPAINAGNNSLARDADGNPLTTDQRGPGFARIVNGIVDIGAYEAPISAGRLAGRLSPVSASPLQPSAHLAKPTIPATSTAVPGFVTAVSAASSPYIPVQIRDAYGVNDIYFNGTPGTGAGQTIALIEAFNDPDIITDANTFSTDYGLPVFNAGGPTLQVVNENGGTNLPSNGQAGTWDVEESLDVEWAHAIAPDANIIVFEANNADNTDLNAAVMTAAATPGVSVVSMSYLSYQLIDFAAGVSETSTDSLYTTPAGHQGVTFVAATGDQGSPATGYPAISPNVVAVGGTSLLAGTDNSYLGESAWSGSGGGLSLQESQPGYQSGNVNGASSTVRTAPDVSMDADPQTGVIVIDSYYGSNLTVGGTSLATPMWGALIAIADQGLALRGQPSLDGPSQTLPMLYDLPSSDFHDITTGDNGFPAIPGYDLASGLGSPIANLLVPALAGYPGTAVWTGLQSNDWFNGNNWNTFSVPNATTNAIINFGNPTAATAIDIAGLTINGGTLHLGAYSGSSTITSLTFTGAGSLDMTNNRLFIDFGSATDPISLIAGYIQSGYSSGAWTGPGIDSSSAAANPSYALGYSDGIDGVVAGLAPGEIEIAYTLNGDANLDGTVNSEDFTILSMNLNEAGRGWDQGDFNYDGTVNTEDFLLMSDNLNLAASQSAAFGALAPGATTLVTATPVTTVKTPAAANISISHTTVRHHPKRKPF
jgi:hypothetical protein